LVQAFARRNRLKVLDSSAARRTVVLSGTVEQMSRAFGVELRHYELPDTKESYRGREGSIHVPKELAGVVQGVFGPDNRRMAKRMAGSGGPASVTPRQVAELYNFPLSVDASGETIGLLEFGGGYNVDNNGTPTDVAAYMGGQSLNTPLISAVPVDGAANSPGVDGPSDMEVALDIEVASAVAQGAAIAVYFAPFTEQGWVDIVTTAIRGEGLPPGWTPPSVISISWGWTEFEAYGAFAWTRAAMDAVDETFQEAAALGVTVLVASGDNGSDCQIGDGKAHVYYPASDPWVTTCGGTSIQSVSGNQFVETWNDYGVTGGGVSDMFPVPDWQAGEPIPGSLNDGHFGRSIPDIAGHADGYTIFVDGSTQGPVQGTSETAPLYAGLVALINAFVGTSVGFLNPLLYQLGGSSLFRDIADNGSNADGPALGYTAVPGWDACTGWGSVDGMRLLNVIETRQFTAILPAVV
jgi:kumamolisin